MCAPGDQVGDGSETSANPGWRKAVALIVGTKHDGINMDGLRELAPEMGAYINEVSSYLSLVIPSQPIPDPTSSLTPFHFHPR